jgi:hypothetical protein
MRAIKTGRSDPTNPPSEALKVVFFSTLSNDQVLSIVDRRPCLQISLALLGRFFHHFCVEFGNLR